MPPDARDPPSGLPPPVRDAGGPVTVPPTRTSPGRAPRPPDRTPGRGGVRPRRLWRRRLRARAVARPSAAPSGRARPPARGGRPATGLAVGAGRTRRQARLRRGRAAWPLAPTLSPHPERAAWAGCPSRRRPRGSSTSRCASGRRYTERRAVAVLPSAPGPRSPPLDLHVLKPTAEALGPHRRILALIERLNALRRTSWSVRGSHRRYDPANAPAGQDDLPDPLGGEHLGRSRRRLRHHREPRCGVPRHAQGLVRGDGGAGGERPDDASVDWGPTTFPARRFRLL